MSRRAIEELSGQWQKGLATSKSAVTLLSERYPGITPEHFTDLEMGLASIPCAEDLSEGIYSSLKSFGIMEEDLNGMVSIPLRKKSGVITNFLFLSLNGESDRIIRSGGIIHSKALPVFKRIILTDNLPDFFAYISKVKQNIIPVIESGMPADLKDAFIHHGTEEVIYINESPYFDDVKGHLAGTGIREYAVTLPDGMSLSEFTSKYSANKIISYLDSARHKYIEAEKAKRIKERGLKESTPTDSGDLSLPPPGVRGPVRAVVQGQEEAVSENENTPAEYLTMTEGTGEVIFTGTDRKYQVRGFNREGFEKVVQICLFADDRVFPDKVDLSRSQGRMRFANIAAAEFEMSVETVRDDLAYIYRKLDALQDERFREKAGIVEKNVHISTPDDITKAKNRLNKRDLLTEILQSDCEKLGYIEERINKMLFMLSGVSRLTGEPLSLLDISPPGTGKSFGMSTVMGLIPPDGVLKYSRLTPNALYYKSESDLKGRVLFIEEIVGMENSLEALRMLISSGELAVSGVEKDARTGQLKTVERRIRADIPVVSTGVRDIFDEETLSRFILTYNETTDEHMKRIMKAQGHRYSLDGEKVKLARERIQESHWHIQRSFDPELRVINPYHEKVQVNLRLPIASRKNMQYLRLMHNIAFTRQHTREKRQERDRAGNTFSYIEVTREDVQTANEIASYVFRYAASDLTLRQQEAYNTIYRHCVDAVKGKKIGEYEYRFSRREIRERYGWEASATKRLFDELERLEYIRKTGGSGQGMRYLYQLITIGERKAEELMLNFIDPSKI